MKFNVTFKHGSKTVAVVKGILEIDRDPDLVKMNDLGAAALTVEKELEKLTGLRVHVETE